LLDDVLHGVGGNHVDGAIQRVEVDIDEVTGFDAEIIATVGHEAVVAHEGLGVFIRGSSFAQDWVEFGEGTRFPEYGALDATTSLVAQTREFIENRLDVRGVDGPANGCRVYVANAAFPDRLLFVTTKLEVPRFSGVSVDDQHPGMSGPVDAIRHWFEDVVFWDGDLLVGKDQGDKGVVSHD